MIQVFHDETGRITSYTTDAMISGGIETDISPDDIGLYLVVDGHLTDDVTAHRVRSIREIKRHAAEQIAALDWRIERATEHDRLGLPGETVEHVLIEREAIRRASNRIEAQIEAAETVADIRAIAFEVTDADYAASNRITRLQFLRRFTDAEMAAILTASDSNAALRSALLKWQTAEGIVLTDPATVSGVNALEIAGLIGEGRAAEILA